MVLRVIQRDETGLVQALREGRRDAPTALWHRFGQRIHRLVLRTIGPDVAVEELVQETFTRLLERIPTIRHEAALEGFVVAVTLNTVRLELRRRRRGRFFSALFTSDEPVADAPSVGSRSSSSLRNSAPSLSSNASPSRCGTSSSSS